MPATLLAVTIVALILMISTMARPFFPPGKSAISAAIIIAAAALARSQTLNTPVEGYPTGFT